jgi:hypothetical protein
LPPFFPSSRRRRTPAVDRHLIGRPKSADTDSVSGSRWWPDPACQLFESPLPRTSSQIWAGSGRFGPFRTDLARDHFYFWNALLNLIILWTLKFNRN